MKKSSLVLSCILSVALAFTKVPVYATVAGSEVVQNYAILKALTWSGGSATDSNVYWASTIERYQAVVITAYLLGIEHEIYGVLSDAPNFTDTHGENEYVKKVMAFAMANPELGFLPYEDGSFRPREYATTQQIFDMMALTHESTENLSRVWSHMFVEAASDGLRDKGTLTHAQLASILAVLNNPTHGGRYFSEPLPGKADCTGRKPPVTLKALLIEKFRLNNLYNHCFFKN